MSKFLRNLVVILFILVLSCNKHNQQESLSALASVSKNNMLILPRSSFNKSLDSLEFMMSTGNQAGFTNQLQKLVQKYQVAKNTNDKKEELRSLILINDTMLVNQHFDQAIQFYSDGNQEIINEFGEHSDEVKCCKRWLAWAYGYSGNFLQEREITNTLLQHELGEEKKDVIAIADYYNTLALNYAADGDFVTQLNFLKSAKEYINLPVEPDFSNDPIRFLAKLNIESSLSIAYVESQDFGKALEYARNCVQARMQHSLITPELSISFMTMGRSFAGMKISDSAINYMDKALNTLQQFTMVGSPQWISYTGYRAEMDIVAGDTVLGISKLLQSIHSNKGTTVPTLKEIVVSQYYKVIDILLEQKNYSDAKKLLTEAIAYIQQNTNQIRNALKLKLFAQQGEVLVAMKDWKGAEQTLLYAIKDSQYAYTSKIYSNEKLPVSTPQFIVDPLQSLANLYYAKSLEEKNATAKTALLKKSISILNQLVNLTNQEESYYFKENANHLLERPLNANNRSTEMILSAYLSLDSLRKSGGQQSGEVTEDIAQGFLDAIESSKSRILENHLAREALLSNILTLSETAERSSKKRRLDSLFGVCSVSNKESAQLALQKEVELFNTFEKKLFEKYHVDENVVRRNTSINELKKLPSGNASITYFLGEGGLYFWSVLNGDIRYGYKKVHQELQSIDSVRTFFYDGIELKKLTEERVVNYKRTLSDLFHLCIDSAFGNLSDIKDLTVVPSRSLCYVNFETLIDPRDNLYLIEKFPLHYEVALKSSGDNNKVYEADSYFGAFAASKFGSTSSDIAMRGFRGAVIQDLPNTEKEVLALSSKLKGTSYLNTTKEEFLREAEKYKIIHLATHSFSSNDISEPGFILFEQNKQSTDHILSSSEVGRLNLHAQFCMLAMCESGTGVLNDNEGVLSIGRSFVEQGVPSVGVSMWSLPDNAGTVEIMQQFYENLKSGLVKSKALQEAKLSYLRSHKGLLESQPYYWSGIVILGDNEALVPTSKWLKYTWWLLGLGLLAILAYFNLRKKRSARSA